MADITSLKRLAEQLPIHTVNQHAALETSDPSFELSVTPTSTYVWPDVDTEGTLNDSKIVVVTAPGAGGKSAAARAIAARCGSPLVDLAKLQVGSDSLVGLLTRVLGWDRAADFVNNLRDGKITLVLDSLDEAQLLAGRENFFAFLKNVASLALGSNSGCRIILLGRRDAANTATNFLKDQGIPVASWSIRALYHTLGSELINATLDHKQRSDGTAYAVHRSHPIPFGKYRDQVFADIASALGVVETLDPTKYWPEVQDFLGYPPVLIVLAEKLAVDNPEAYIANGTQVRHAGDRTAQGALLRQIVEGILDRESYKVQAQLGEGLGLTESATRLLYLREEQSLRVLKEVSGGPIEIESPGILETADRSTYESLIEPFLPDHPFVSNGKFSNIVFSDYVRAFIATSDTVPVCGLRHEELLSLTPSVGPFFAQFVYALTQDSVGESPEGPVRGRVMESIVDSLVKSHTAGGSDAASALYNHVKSAPNARLTLSDTESLTQNVFTIEFDIEDSSGILELSSPISNFAIATDHALLLTGVHGEIELGPNVLCVANEVEIDGSRLTVTGRDSASVFILAGGVSHSADLRLSAYPSNCLSVYWPSAWHQWRGVCSGPCGPRAIRRPDGGVSGPLLGPPHSYVL